MDSSDAPRSATGKLSGAARRPLSSKSISSTKQTDLSLPRNASEAPTADGRYGKLCQLSYAPATRTTVVTTTTTTTTAFPPFVVKEPRNLASRDTRSYPLASKPTPDALKRFTFKLGGEVACFEEAAEVNATPKEVVQQQTRVTASNDQWRFSQSLSSSLNSISSLGSTKKRSAPEYSPDCTPESLQEGAEFSRPSKRPRRRAPTRTNRSRSPITPHSQALRRERTLGRFGEHDGEGAAHETPVSFTADSGHVLRRPSHATLPSQLHTSFEPASSPSHTLGTISPDTISGPPSPPSFIEALAMVATPPVGELDMDPSNSFAAALQSTPSLDTSTDTPLDDSLPSPLPSPVSASPTIPSADEDNDDEASGFELAPLQSTHKTFQNTHSTVLAPVDSSPFAQISSMVDAFDSYPAELQQYLMYQFLRRCNKQVLQFTAAVVNPALKCDFLSRLPPELSLNVIRNLDAQSLCRSAQVSRRWRELIDTDDRAWRDLITEDGFVLPKGEVQRAIREGWKWQGLSPCEIDLSRELQSRSSSPVALSTPESQLFTSTPMGRSLKRKALFHDEGNKRRKTSHALMESCPWVPGTPESRRGSSTDIAARTADIPLLGLKHLRIPHLYKSIYRRHHGFLQGWMDRDTEPHHIAFRAHGRHVVTCLQFDDDKILTGSDDTKIHVYNTNTGALVKQLDGHEGGVWALQYDGNTLVSGSTDRTVRVWDIEKGRCRHVFQGHTSTVRCLVILKPTVVGHEADGTPIMMPKEPLIITGSRDSTLRIWSLPRPGDIPFNPTGHSLTTDEQNPYFIRALTGHIHSVRAIAAHGDTLVSGSYDSTVRVWRISTGEVIHRLNGHAQKVYSVILDHQRNRCISGSMDNLVKVWSLETGQCIFNLEGHSSLVGLLDLNTGRLVSAAADWTLRVWDPETGHCKNILQAHTGAITCFQHDSQKVVSGSDRTLKMWNIQTGECVRDLLTDLSGGWQVKFNDRKCVAAVQRHNRTYIEVLDFGAARDGMPQHKLGTRILVDERGHEIEDLSDEEDDE